MERYLIRELQEGDEDSLLRTFAEVFGAKRTREEWRWAFQHNPAGSRVFVALTGGKVVAQYAALPTRVWSDGEEYGFSQIVDSMVHPEHRKGLKRPGLFVRTGEAFFEHFGDVRRDIVFHGWPTAENWRIGERFLGYERAATQMLLTRPVEPHFDVLPADCVELTGRFDHEVQWLYERCCSAWGASTIRDAGYMNWRYVDKPNADYVCIGVRGEQDVLRGLCVFGVREWGGEQVALVLDWLVPADEPEVAEALLVALDVGARERGATQTTLMVPFSSPWFSALQREGYHVQRSPYDHIVRSFHPRFDADFLREHWWVQLGDSDLV